MTNARKTTAFEILEALFGEGEERAYRTRTDVRHTLEDGAALKALGFTDDDQEAVEEAHALVSSSAEELMAQAREALIADCENFSDEEIIDGRGFFARIPVGCCDGIEVFDELEINTAYSDNKLEPGATTEEVNALCDRLIEDALNEFKQTLFIHGVD